MRGGGELGQRVQHVGVLFARVSLAGDGVALGKAGQIRQLSVQFFHFIVIPLKKLEKRRLGASSALKLSLEVHQII